MDSFFKVERSPDGIAHLQLNRPERMNTMSGPFFPALHDAVRGLDDDGATRVLVLSSTGKHFSAGMSLDAFQPGEPLLDTRTARARLRFHRTLGELIESFDALDRARFPTICVVQGGCIGGGLDLACASDIRVCTADAFFCVQEINIGMAADLGSLQRLPKLIAPGLARQLAYTGERLDAQRALAAGLVNAVLPDAAAALEHAMALAREIAAKSPLAIATSKLALNHARDHGTAESLAQMQLVQSALLDMGEAEKAIAGRKGEAARFDSLLPAGLGK